MFFILNCICLGLYAIDNGDQTVLKEFGSFMDSNDSFNIVGVVDNNGDYPIGQVIVALNLTASSGGLSEGLSILVMLILMTPSHKETLLMQVLPPI